jgi:hypothetical protein
MAYIEILDPVSISNTTSRREEDHWRVFNFVYNRNTTCISYPAGNTIDNTLAYVMVSDGVVPGIVRDPYVRMANEEFRNMDKAVPVAFATFLTAGILLYFVS